MTKKCLKWLNDNNSRCPKLVFDLTKVRENYNLYKKSFSEINPYYAVKANPNKNIIILLRDLGCCFDCASIQEIEHCLSLKVDPKKISYGNTIKKEEDIFSAHKMGVKLFAFDSLPELIKISNNAPNSRVFCRIQVSNTGSEWPLSKKFGCSPEEAEKLLFKAASLKTIPVGLSFHVGSQQKCFNAWKKAIAKTASIYKKVKSKNLELDFLNIGGGFPSTYKSKTPCISKYSESILTFLNNSFGNSKPSKIISEPGRFLVADAGIIETEIILIVKRKPKDKFKWLYIDVGRYNGLAETEGELIKYKIQAKNYNSGHKSKYILAGPSCDSHDILYEKNLYSLPKNIKIGDKLRIYSTGAYTSVYSTKFNGMKQLKEFYID